MLEQIVAAHAAPVQARGSVWESSSLLWGYPGGAGAWLDQRSVLDGTLLQRTRLLDQHEIERLFAAPPSAAIAPGEIRSFAMRLEQALSALAPALLETLPHETGFVARDCYELIDGSLAYLREFPELIERLALEPPAPLSYRLPAETRQIRLVRVGWGTIAVILPQNAFLLVALTALLNALVTGNRVILRAPQQSARSAALLATALRSADLPSESVSVVLADAREFVAGVWHAPQPVLLHYMGSSQHAPQLVADAFRWGKPTLIDGTGNSWVWVDADVDVAWAAELLTSGALRYNGQTCTSVNGALIHPTIYPALRAQLVARWSELRADSVLAAEVDVGPLFDEQQAIWCQQQIDQSGGRIICGGRRSGNLLQPTLVEEPTPQSALVREGLFGPGMWIATADRETFLARWSHNRYPLSVGVLSAAADAAWWAARLPNVARLLFNGDPSVEHIFEPWGGYPASSANPVGLWHEKYQRVVSIDEPLGPMRRYVGPGPRASG